MKNRLGILIGFLALLGVGLFLMTRGGDQKIASVKKAQTHDAGTSPEVATVSTQSSVSGVAAGSSPAPAVVSPTAHREEAEA